MIVDSLWNDDVRDAWLADGAASGYRSAILEQYKLYVEMADRISQRRALANTFFLTLNTAAFTVIGVFWKDRPDTSAGWLVLPLVVALGQCAAWFSILRSYRQLNSAKYEVIGEMEKRLPASPYWGAEWAKLGGGKDWRTYWPLTHGEKYIPLLFAATYVAGFVAAVIAS
jgi:hypothetical protein